MCKGFPQYAKKSRFHRYFLIDSLSESDKLMSNYGIHA